MELLDSMGRELAWGLLALQQQSVSRAGLLAAIDVWHGLPHQPLGQILEIPFVSALIHSFSCKKGVRAMHRGRLPDHQDRLRGVGGRVFGFHDGKTETPR